MKTIIQLAVLVPLAIVAVGCTTSYLGDRAADAMDIFTATVGNGLGAKAQAGPVNVGLFLGGDTFGLRAGALTEFNRSGFGWTRMIEGNATIISGEQFQPSGGDFKNRNKQYVSIGVLGIAVPSVPPHRGPWNRGHLYRLTQIEVAAGLGYTLRLGFNPGELLDFILGWFTIDIFNDDLEWKKRKSNKTMEPIP